MQRKSRIRKGPQPLQTRPPVQPDQASNGDRFVDSGISSNNVIACWISINARWLSPAFIASRETSTYCSAASVKWPASAADARQPALDLSASLALIWVHPQAEGAGTFAFQDRYHRAHSLGVLETMPQASDVPNERADVRIADAVVRSVSRFVFSCEGGGVFVAALAASRFDLINLHRIKQRGEHAHTFFVARRWIECVLATRLMEEETALSCGSWRLYLSS